MIIHASNPSACFNAPPANLSSANSTWNGLPAIVDERIVYSCPETWATAIGEYNTTLICQSGDWTPLDTSYTLSNLIQHFICEPG